MKQLKHETVRAKLHERNGGGMMEHAIGLARHAGEVVLRDGSSDERTHHVDGNLGIGPAGESGEPVRIEAWPGFRHIESAVAGEAREGDIDEPERRGLAPRRHIAHVRRPSHRTDTAMTAPTGPPLWVLLSMSLLPHLDSNGKARPAQGTGSPAWRSAKSLVR